MKVSVKDNIAQGNNYFTDNLGHFARAVYGSPQISRKDISVARLAIASLATVLFLGRVNSEWGQAHIPYASRIMETMQNLDSFTGIKHVFESASAIVALVSLGYFVGHTKLDSPFGTNNGTLRGIGIQKSASYLFDKIFGED